MTDNQINQLHHRVTTLEENLKINTESTQRIEANTSELVKAFDNLQGALKVLNWVGSLAKPMGYIVALVASVWAFIAAVKGGGIGPK